MPRTFFPLTVIPRLVMKYITRHLNLIFSIRKQRLERDRRQVDRQLGRRHRPHPAYHGAGAYRGPADRGGEQLGGEDVRGAEGAGGAQFPQEDEDDLGRLGGVGDEAGGHAGHAADEEARISLEFRVPTF